MKKIFHQRLFALIFLQEGPINSILSPVCYICIALSKYTNMAILPYGHMAIGNMAIMVADMVYLEKAIKMQQSGEEIKLIKIKAVSIETFN